MITNIAYNDNKCIIAFRNSNGELEYRVYESTDGGIIDVNGDGEYLDELMMIAEENRIDDEIKGVIEC